ncbi:61f051a7-b2bd-44ad-bda2-4100e8cb915f [Sclerotinia trifoliorum]|uniref:61f051a7-b2bd-44ad-bda2-4100e8cb915f n=1 Tax=Sclerotinia trifoliorum TaxID=28548 RepID=A0A8H2VTU5_9HELO|nr:61f051a7-b2bd-44ad-bda2-4100e8cb915f [Sclerotinia trifoliorum]
MSIGVAIIGSGIFAQTEHLPAVQSTPHLSLKAIYSRSLSSAQSLNVDVPLYSDDSGVGKTFHDLLLRSDIHAVIIALPILVQPEYIEAALAAGKHVLSEKPIAGDLERAQCLLEYYKSDKVKDGATWSVAENFRFLHSFIHARKEIEKLGRVLGFRMQSFGNVKQGSRYYETEWRKKPDHQGGFLLDGGVHSTAAGRLLLGGAARPTSVVAFSTLLREHLPPVDTINSVWLTNFGISGTFSVSFGTTLSGPEYTVACEDGSVTVIRSKVIVRKGEEREKNFTEVEFTEEGSGVKQEVAAWAQSIVDKKPDTRQSPEEALADLEILEKLLRSGEEQGKSQNLHFQI